MTIKYRLIVSFASFVLLMLIMGVILISFTLQYEKRFDTNSYHYSRLFFWQEIYHAYDIQWRALNYYISNKNREHLRRFWDQSNLIAEKAKYLPSPREELDDWYSKYTKLNLLVKKYTTPSSHILPEIFNKKLLRLNGDLHGELRTIINNHSDKINTLKKEIDSLNSFGMVVAAIFSCLAVFLSALISYFIYRSIIYPLSIFQKGTTMVGEGNMDYQIRIDSKDEIGQLAVSFNSMIENLRNLQLQIIQMDRMSSIGQLAGGVAHEINNPLTGVLGQSQLLLDKLPKDSQYRRTVERIESSAQRCRTIVRALLDFAREKNYKFHPTDINELVNETLDFTKSEMNSKKIHLEKDIPDPMPYVQVSAGHVQQVFLNMINNAIHAMPRGGKLLISASMVENNVFEIAFTDTGIGIKKENLSHVFDPFFTTKDIGKGTGLGLTISYGIIKRHKGEILVRSDGENKGTTFLIRLPISHEAPDDKERVAQLFSTPPIDHEPLPKKDTRF